jgi:hypothetical protein
MPIDNFSQLIGTLAACVKFTEGIAAHDRATRPPDVVVELWAAERDGMASQLRDLLDEASEFINRVIEGGR